MPEQLIREVAQQVAAQQLLSNAELYLVALLLIVVSSAASSYFGSYFRRRGEALATKTDFDALAAQLRTTTTIAEGVRTAIAHNDWATREQKMLRRLKLEELLEACFAFVQWSESLRDHCLYNGPEPAASLTVAKVRMLGALYFPELSEPVRAFIVAVHEYQLWLFRKRGAIQELYATPFAQNEERLRATNEMPDHYGPLIQALGEVENAAERLMPRILNVEQEPAANDER